MKNEAEVKIKRKNNFSDTHQEKAARCSGSPILGSCRPMPSALNSISPSQTVDVQL